MEPSTVSCSGLAGRAGPSSVRCGQNSAAGTRLGPCSCHAMLTHRVMFLFVCFWPPLQGIMGKWVMLLAQMVRRSGSTADGQFASGLPRLGLKITL